MSARFLGLSSLGVPAPDDDSEKTYQFMATGLGVPSHVAVAFRESWLVISKARLRVDRFLLGSRSPPDLMARPIPHLAAVVVCSIHFLQ